MLAPRGLNRTFYHIATWLYPHTSSATAVLPHLSSVMCLVLPELLEILTCTFRRHASEILPGLHSRMESRRDVKTMTKLVLLKPQQAVR